MQKVSYRKGEVIISEGEDGRTAFLVVSGIVEVIVGNAPRPKRVATMTVGEVFGEVSLLDPGPRSATVRAVTDVECAVTSYDDFIAAIQSDPDKAVAFMRTLVRRLRQTNEMLIQMDPQKRGIRELISGMHRTVSHKLTVPDMTEKDWFDYGAV